MKLTPIFLVRFSALFIALEISDRVQEEQVLDLVLVVNASNSKDLIFSSMRAKLEFVVDIMIFSLFDFRMLRLSRTYTSESVSTSVVLLAFSNSNF